MSNSKHHIIPTSIGGTNNCKNLKDWRQTPHMAFHILFENLPFKYQVAKLIDINGESLNHQIGSDIKGYIGNYAMDELYNPKCVDFHKMWNWEKKNKKRIQTIIGR